MRLHSTGLRLPSRLAILGAVLVVEILLISLWLDAEVLRGRGALAGLVHDWGAWSVRLGVAIVLGSLIFAESRARTDLKRISDGCAAFPIRWPLLAAHATTMVLFLWLSSILFQGQGTAVLANTLVLFWALVGFLSLALAAVAMVPVPVWIDIFRSTGDAWIYGIVGGLVAMTLGSLAQRLWEPLSHWTLSLVAMMMRPFVPVLLVDPSTMMIGTSKFHEWIAPQCSGYEGMGMILAFSSAWLWFFRRQWRFPQALLLIPAGVAVIFLANAVRIAALLLIGNAGAPGIAEGGFHSQAGWMAFNAVAIGICLLARKIPALTNARPSEPPCAACGLLDSTRNPHAAHGGSEVFSSNCYLRDSSDDVLVHHEGEVETVNPTIPYLLPFLAILGAAMISRAMAADFEWFYSLRVVAAAGALWYSRRAYRALDFRFGWLGVAAGAVVFAIWIALEPAGHSAAPAALANAPHMSRISWITLRIAGAVVMVPVAEELAFRGFLLRRLSSSDFESVSWTAFAWAPFLISSAAFGIMHGERWLAGTIAGALFALVQIRRGRIGDAIVAHVVANVLVAAWVLIGGNWQLW
jgi:CAAX prenyl protease-like protein